HVGTRNTARVEPRIVGTGDPERNLVVLVATLADVNSISVIVEQRSQPARRRGALDLLLRPTGRCGLAVLLPLNHQSLDLGERIGLLKLKSELIKVPQFRLVLRYEVRQVCAGVSSAAVLFEVLLRVLARALAGV